MNFLSAVTYRTVPGRRLSQCCTESPGFHIRCQVRRFLRQADILSRSLRGILAHAQIKKLTPAPLVLLLLRIVDVQIATSKHEQHSNISFSEGPSKISFGFESGAGASTSAVLVLSVYVQNIVNVCLG